MLKCHNFEIPWWWCIQVVILFHQVRQIWWIQWVIIINKNHLPLQVELRKKKEKDKWYKLSKCRMFYYFSFVSLFFLHNRCSYFYSSFEFWCRHLCAFIAFCVSSSSSLCSAAQQQKKKIKKEILTQQQKSPITGSLCWM